jgi:hypothetical protein
MDHMLNAIERGLAEQICSERVNEKEFCSRWANLPDRQNELLVQIGAEIEQQLAR